VISQEALIRLLVEKGIFPKEVLERMNVVNLDLPKKGMAKG
jgi:hypothetical protein